ncbi:MAG TPA: hypothetical protein VI565_12090 [Burkholderiales bacterium]|nr:hypothetical protein [Burkholderiales bacterium]
MSASTARATPIPEYVHGVPPVSHSVAYASEATAGQATFVRVRFSRTAASPKSFMVRALDGGVLGAIARFKVDFKDTQNSVEIDVPLAARDFSTVGRFDVSWKWSFQSGLSWQVFATSRHRVFLLLSTPPAPWSQAPNNARNPWTHLLDFSCAMASGSTNAVDALRALTKKIHTDYALQYDVTGANQKYGIGDTRIVGQDKFRLADWINWVLKGGILSGAPGALRDKVCPGNPHEYFAYLSPACFDCAAALALMARSVGVPADYVFHAKFGYLNYVEPIGRVKANNPFYNSACIPQAPEVGPDTPRAVVDIHAYVRLGGRNYDATYREWLDPVWKLVFIWVAFFLLFFPPQRLGVYYWFDRAFGWITDTPQPEYEQRLIDRSFGFEQDPDFTGGAPVVLPLDFYV